MPQAREPREQKSQKPRFSPTFATTPTFAILANKQPTSSIEGTTNTENAELVTPTRPYKIPRTLYNDTEKAGERRTASKQGAFNRRKKQNPRDHQYEQEQSKGEKELKPHAKQKLLFTESLPTIIVRNNFRNVSTNRPLVTKETLLNVPNPQSKKTSHSTHHKRRNVNTRQKNARRISEPWLSMP